MEIVNKKKILTFGPNFFFRGWPETQVFFFWHNSTYTFYKIMPLCKFNVEIVFAQ